MTDIDNVKNNWVQLRCDTDYYINLVCPHCGCICSDEEEQWKIIIRDQKSSVYCTECFDKFAKNEDQKDLTIVNIDDINAKLIKSVLENSSSIKFIGGMNLYIDFLFLVKNYRKKVEFCNW
jgi:hypothetical protein